MKLKYYNLQNIVSDFFSGPKRGGKYHVCRGNEWWSGLVGRCWCHLAPVEFWCVYVSLLLDHVGVQQHLH